MHRQSLIFILFFSLLSYYNHAQQGLITYGLYNNGNNEKVSDVEMKIKDGVVYLNEATSKIRTFSDYNRKEKVSIIKFEGEFFRTIQSFDSLTLPSFSDKKDSILGYECQLATFMYFSNKIEVFFTEKSDLAGIPYSNFLPNEKALALKIIVNGNRTLIAESIGTLNNNDEDLIYPYKEAKKVTKAQFEELKIRSRYTSMNVFKDQIVNFDTSLPDEDLSLNLFDKIFRLSKGTVVLRKIKLPQSIREGAYTFLDFSCRSNGDAYDRTGSVFAIKSGKAINMLNALDDSIGVLPVFTDKNGKEYQGFMKTENFEPAIELMRFFTTFGVKHFNKKREIASYDWENTAHYKQDISDLIPTDTDELWIGVFIGNYNKGGHIIDLNLSFYPSYEEIDSLNRWIQPLFNTVNIMEMSGQNYACLFKTDSLKVEFELPEGLKDQKLYFTSTGHGGWGGGDEFNPKLNQILIDDKVVFSIVPWRSDCATYRLFNPASGNFENGLSSSDFSRSNWCPGTLTNPYIIPLHDLTPGKHKIEVVIDQGDDAGSSFNAWSISGVLIGNK